MPVKPSDPVINDTTPEEIATTAKKFLGVRYLAGGLTAQGMDTRGLIYLVYRIHGIPSGTDGASFRAKAEHVSKKELQPGDILVFHGESAGLFLGNGRFLQTSKKNSVQLVGIYDRQVCQRPPVRAAHHRLQPRSKENNGRDDGRRNPPCPGAGVEAAAWQTNRVLG